MDDVNGIDITLILKEKFPSIKIIILTMHKEQRMVSYLMEIGAHGYLFKDTTRDELITAIEKVLTTGFYFNAYISEILLEQIKNKSKTIPVLKGNYHLTPRENEVLHLISKEYITSEIADKLHLSIRTIEGYRKNLLSKMGVKNSAGLIIKAIKLGLISI